MRFRFPYAAIRAKRFLLPASYFLIPIIPFKRLHYKGGFLHKFFLAILCIIYKTIKHDKNAYADLSERMVR